jgi:hypothetical protein
MSKNRDAIRQLSNVKARLERDAEVLSNQLFNLPNPEAAADAVVFGAISSVLEGWGSVWEVKEFNMELWDTACSVPEIAEAARAAAAAAEAKEFELNRDIDALHRLIRGLDHEIHGIAKILAAEKRAAQVAYDFSLKARCHVRQMHAA